MKCCSAGTRIGPRIRKAREDAGLDMRTLATELGTLVRTVNAYETGILVPELYRLEMIAKVTGTTTAWLIDTGAVVVDNEPAAYPTAQMIAEDGGYPPTLVEALGTVDGIFVATLRSGRKIIFGGAELVGDGSLWIRLTGVSDDELDLLTETDDGEVDIDIRLDEILWCCNITPPGNAGA